jgi:hypothetical protein
LALVEFELVQFPKANGCVSIELHEIIKIRSKTYFCIL